jgi:hypothetical protein
VAIGGKHRYLLVGAVSLAGLAVIKGRDQSPIGFAPNQNLSLSLSACKGSAEQ